MDAKPKYFMVKLESYEGEDTYVRCGDDRETQDFLYCVVAIDSDGSAEVVDSGYRSEQEVRQAWPELAGRIKGRT